MVKKILGDHFIQPRPLSLQGLQMKCPVANSVADFRFSLRSSDRYLRCMRDGGDGNYRADKYLRLCI